MRQFHAAFPIRHALRAELSWTHYRKIMTCGTQAERDYYVQAAADEGWSTRELERQIDSGYYWRLRSTQKAEVAAPEASRAASVDNVFKDPYVLEFLDLPRDALKLEKNLEQALVDAMQAFLMELGRGFTFCGRQVRVTDEDKDYYIDLVFYNYVLNCFVFIDLKTHGITPADVGQMDFYVHLFDDQCRPKDANPTVGLLLGTNKSLGVAKYTALARDDRLLAAQYLTQLPTEEELATALERNRREFEAAQEVRLLEKGRAAPSEG